MHLKTSNLASKRSRWNYLSSACYGCRCFKNQTGGFKTRKGRNSFSRRAILFSPKGEVIFFLTCILRPVSLSYYKGKGLGHVLSSTPCNFWAVLYRYHNYFSDCVFQWKEIRGGVVCFQADIDGTALVFRYIRPPRPFDMSLSLKCNEHTFDALEMRKNLPTSLRIACMHRFVISSSSRNLKNPIFIIIIFIILSNVILQYTKNTSVQYNVDITNKLQLHI